MYTVLIKGCTKMGHYKLDSHQDFNFPYRFFTNCQQDIAVLKDQVLIFATDYYKAQLPSDTKSRSAAIRHDTSVIMLDKLFKLLNETVLQVLNQHES